MKRANTADIPVDGLPAASGKTMSGSAIAATGASLRVRRTLGLRAMLRLLPLFQTPLERRRPPATRLRLIATLFGRASNVLMVALAALICGSAAWLRGGGVLAAVIAGAEVVMLLVRCAVILAFQRRQREGAIGNPDIWLIRFAVLAVASSAAWGALCFICLAFSHDPVLYVIPVLSTVGTAGAVAARNSGAPRLAKLQLAFSLVPILCGAVFADDRGYLLLLLLVPAMATGLLILLAERNEQLVELIETQAELARLSRTDALTQLANRRQLDACLDATAADGAAFALLMIDVDHFKAFNDRHGHPAGDALLIRIAAILQAQLRGRRDVVARYGGEEFAILIEGASLAEAMVVGERLRAAVQGACRHPDDQTPITISVGVAVSTGTSEAARVVSDADSALYLAKRSGRNRVESAIVFESIPLADARAA